MKKIAFIAALCSSLAVAQEAPVAPEAVAPEAAVACTPAEAEAMVDEVIAALTEVVEVLESVTDTASADAAVAKLEAVKVRMEAAGQNILENDCYGSEALKACMENL